MTLGKGRIMDRERKVSAGRKVGMETEQESQDRGFCPALWGSLCLTTAVP